MISKVFFDMIDTVCNEYHLEKDDVADAIKTALVKAIQADDHKGIVEVVLDYDTNKIRIFETFNVVDKSVEDYEYKRGDVSLEEALVLKTRVKVGSEIRNEIPFSTIGRKVVMRFKQIWIQELKSLRTRSAYQFFKENEGEVINAIIEKVTSNAIILNIGHNTFSYMPVEEGLGGEEYIVGNQLKVCISKVEETTKGPKVYVSRSQKEIIKRLFEANIPEITQGVLEIMGISREPGNRTKIGIKSNNPNVDAKGSCVGIGGARIKQINNALNGERIDIFEWKDDPVELIAESLSPATCISVLADVELRKCLVIVPDDQFSLAIGKGGQNVRLASQVTGWKIDIKDETTAYRDGISFVPNVKKVN